MFTIEKPKQIHIKKWKEIIELSLPSHNFQYENINFDMFWSNIFQDDFFTFAAKNEDKFMGIIVARLNETYFQKIIELYYFLEIGLVQSSNDYAHEFILIFCRKSKEIVLKNITPKHIKINIFILKIV